MNIEEGLAITPQADHTIQLSWLFRQLTEAGVYAFLLCLTDQVFRMDSAAAIGEVANHASLMFVVTPIDNKIAAITAASIARFLVTGVWSFDNIKQECTKKYAFESEQLDELLAPDGVHPLVGASYVLHHAHAIQKYLKLVRTAPAFRVLPQSVVDALCTRLDRTLQAYACVFDSYNAALRALDPNHEDITEDTTASQIQFRIWASEEGPCTYKQLENAVKICYAASGVAGASAPRFLLYDAASRYMQQFKLQTRQDFRDWCQPGTRPSNIPPDPSSEYGSQGKCHAHVT